ncbi:MAG: DUF4230 domain-containing protein [Chthoniobacterales bacterium]
MHAEPPRQRRFSWALAFILVVLIAAALLGFIFWRVESWPMRTAQQSTLELERLGREVRDAFVQFAHIQPRITIHDRVYLEQTTAVAELALVSRRTEVEHEFEHTWAGSTKRVKLHGTYAVKAGFDLHDNVSADVGPQEIAVRIPHAVILGVEQKEVDVLEFENGLWNRISAEDVQNELAQLPILARAKAEAAGLTSEAEAALRQQLAARLGTARPLRLEFSPAPVTPKP